MDKKDNYLLFALIAIGIILRFIAPFDIPYTHDEFSALFRTNFDNFSDLIEKGVKTTDTHPAGVQVFMYYWILLFGNSELIVKLPFIIFGLLSLGLVYKIGKKWFNPFAGLLAVAYIATIQYSIIYSQMARPYISGLFFSLAMIYYWDKIVFNPENKFIKNASLFIFFSTICAYNHHFSLLFAAIVGFTGLFFIEKSYLTKYLLIGLMIFILYIPHLPIFFYQLNVGGVGNWLARPTYAFFPDYIRYIFHFSFFAIIPAIFISFLSFINPLKKKFYGNKYWVISLLWFLTPMLIGFFYSYYINAVIQYSVLLFSFPFFLFVIFGNIRNYSFSIKLIALISIVAINILTLVVNRKHYDIFYNSFYKEILMQHNENYLKLGSEDYVGIIESLDDITGYYLKNLNLDSTFKWYEDFSNKKKFIEYIRDSEKKYLSFAYTSGSAYSVIPAIMDYYPTIIERRDFYGGTYYLFSKNESVNKTSQTRLITNNNFENIEKKWENCSSENYTDSLSFSGKYSYFISSENEWGPTVEVGLDSILFGQYDFFDVSVLVHKNNSNQGLLVALLESEGNTIYWGASEVNEFPVSDNWTKVYHSIKLPDIDFKNLKNLKLKTFIWNKNKTEYVIDNFQIKIREGNPIIYGLYKEI